MTTSFNKLNKVYSNDELKSSTAENASDKGWEWIIQWDLTDEQAEMTVNS